MKVARATEHSLSGDNDSDRLVVSVPYDDDSSTSDRHHNDGAAVRPRVWAVTFNSGIRGQSIIKLSHLIISEGWPVFQQSNKTNTRFRGRLRDN